MDLSILAGGAGALCTVVAGVGSLLVFVLVIVWWMRRRPAAVAAPADPKAARDELFSTLEPVLGYLGDELEVVKGSKGDLRLKGALRGQPATVVIDADGRFTTLHVQAEFPPGTLVLRPGGNEDPEGLITQVADYEVEPLIEQMGEARLTAIRFEPTGISATSGARMYALERHEQMSVMGQTLAGLENAVGLWQDREIPEPEPEPEPEPPPKPAAPVDPVKAALSWDYWESDDATADLRKGVGVLFPAIEDLLTKPKTVLPEDSDEAELRGRVSDVPIKLQLNAEGEWRIDAKIAEVDDGLIAYYDPTLKPVAGDPDDDWADGDDIRVFLAKGLYVEATPDVIEIYMQFCERLSDEQIDTMRDGMARLPIHSFWFQGDELEIEGRGTIQQIADPVATFRDILTFAGWLGSDIPGAAGGGSFSQVQCEYCSSRYFFGVRRAACPNCGAPPGA